MLHTKFQDDQYFSPEKKVFRQKVFTIHGHRGYLGYDPYSTHKLSFPHSIEAPHVISKK